MARFAFIYTTHYLNRNTLRNTLYIYLFSYRLNYNCLHTAHLDKVNNSRIKQTEFTLETFQQNFL